MKQFPLFFTLFIAVSILTSGYVLGQDIHLSQFFNTPLLRNPALAGVFNGDIRFQAVYRNQWQSIILLSVILCFFKIGLTQRLVAYYPFCGNSQDLSGLNNHGTINGAILTTDRLNIPNRAFSFNGDNTYIFANDHSSFNLTDDFSACGWMMPTTLPPAEFSGIGFALVSKNIGAGNNNPKWIFALQNGRLAFHINGSGLGTGLWVFSNVFPVTINQWNHYGFSKDGNVITFYLNGNPIGNGTLPNPSVNPSTPLYIGYSEPGLGMRGKIDEVRLFDYTLSATEMKNKFSIEDEFVVRVDTLANICPLQSISLPSGKVINIHGTHRDTLKFSNCCDSIIFTFRVADQKQIYFSIDTLICQGQNYTLPSGRMVNASGMYRDTLRYASGCDSAITIVNLTQYDVTTQTESATICLSNSFTLPSGKIISTAGTYRDTLRYANGCDSIRYTISLTVTDAQRNASTAYICAGSSFRLPSGRMASTAGLYRDTVRTAQNCDSLISNITLIVDATTVQTLTPTICEGKTYTLPSGRIVATAGNYADTLRNIRGCDSIRFTVNLSVSAIRFGTASATLCTGQIYTRPSGKIATASGIYLDTIRSLVTGCDSIITTTLTYRTPLSVSLSAPPSVCTGVAASLVATASGGNGGPYTYSWTGATGSGNTVTVSPTATTKYVVTVTDGCTTTPARDSFTIQYVPPPQPGLNNQSISICRGSSTPLIAVGGATYQWTPATGLNNPNITNPTASPETDTRYRVRVTTATGCIGEDSILVRVTQPFTLSASLDTFVCAGGSVPLSASGAQRYEWTGTGLSAATGPNVTARPSVTTTYTVTGYGPDNCFTQTRNIRVTVIALPVVDAGRDTTIMVGTSFALQPAYTGANLQYRWTPPQYLTCTNCATPTVAPREPMEYTINVRNAFGCEANDRIRIELICNGESVFLPNTFTPNGDGVNDVWYPRGGGIRQVKLLKVFNRWGQAIYERTNFNTDDRSAGWDGTFKGQPLPPDVFVYAMVVTCDNGQTVETKGNVMIVR